MPPDALQVEIHYLRERIDRSESRAERLEGQMSEVRDALRADLHALGLKVEQGIGAMKLFAWMTPILVGLVVAVATVVVQKLWR